MEVALGSCRHISLKGVSEGIAIHIMASPRVCWYDVVHECNISDSHVDAKAFECASRINPSASFERGLIVHRQSSGFLLSSSEMPYSHAIGEVRTRPNRGFAGTRS